jgi:hypothetical protein
MATEPAAPLVPLLRRLLYVAAALVFLAGIPLYVFAGDTDRSFAWTIDSRMTAVFLGAAYWSALGLEISAARAAQWSRARIAVPAVFVFTTLTLVVSLVHLHKLHVNDDVTTTPRVVGWLWLAVYTVVPVIMAIGWNAQRQHSTIVPAPGGLPALVRVALDALCAVLLCTGLVLFVCGVISEPEWASDFWPWTLTPITSGAVGAWLVGLGVAAGHARLIDDKPSLRPLGITGVAFGVLQGIALARHGGELDWSSGSAVAYVVTLSVLTIVSAWALVPDRQRGRSHSTSSKRDSPAQASSTVQ